MRLGLIDYINIFPVTYFLGETLGPDWDVVYAPPSRLNALLSEGGLDASPISSVEYARHASDYLLLPDLSVSSRGEVRSVVLYSRHRLEDLDGREITITGATATSRVLLAILLERFVGVRPQYRVGRTLPQRPTATGRGSERVWDVDPEDVGDGSVLLIGDDALAFRQAALHDPALSGFAEYDLGLLWREFTGLPMVFAVWAVRGDVARRPEVKRLVEALHASRARGESLPEVLLACAQKRVGLTHDELLDYYRCLYFTLDVEEEKGLLTFYRHATEMGLCPPCPALGFVPEDILPARGMLDATTDRLLLHGH